MCERCEILRAELEHERVRLAGCGVAALSNTPATIATRAKPGDYGWSASYGDVCAAVDREMKLRAERDQLRKELALAVMGGELAVAEVEALKEKLAYFRTSEEASMAEVEKLRWEVEAMRPVVEAALEWRDAMPGEAVREAAKKLAQIVATYRARTEASK